MSDDGFFAYQQQARTYWKKKRDALRDSNSGDDNMSDAIRQNPPRLCSRGG